MLLLVATTLPLHATEKYKSELHNIVVFVRFADEEASIFENRIDRYETLFNDTTPGSNSVYNYFHSASYGRLSWPSTFYPAAGDSGKIVSYQARNIRNYYKKQSDSNPDGYDDEEAMGMVRVVREQELIKEIADYLHTIVPADATIDADNNGTVDNICIIVSGRSEIGSSHMLWPHRSTLYTKEGYIQGKRVNEYIMLFDDANGYDNLRPIAINTGVLCHEMSHTLGTYDLYHGGAGDNLSPIGVWDLMSDNLVRAQGMSAYTKYKYCHWIDSIPEISSPGTYTLNPVNGTTSENVAYKIKPIGSEQYFIVEYRKQEGLDAELPGQGLLVYRIDPRFTGNNSYDGVSKFDEMYIFRPQGTTTWNGALDTAPFSAESGRVSFGGDATEKPFYTDGTYANLAITNVSACGESISFDLLPEAPIIYLANKSAILPGNASSSTQIAVEANTDWHIETLPEWLDIAPRQGGSGITELTITTLAKNESSAQRSAEIVLAATDASTSATLVISQASGQILAPTGLSATVEGSRVSLSWNMPVSGTIVLTEDFENATSAASWTIRKDSENPRGWARTQADKNTEASDGEYVMKLSSDWDYLHQDEWVISPSFSAGKMLSFRSKSIAPQKNNAHNFYYVLASADNGKNWNIVYDLKTESTAVNKYEQIDIDLSAYLSDSMRIAFRAYDDNNEGLSYWWIVDGINIYPAADSSSIKGYNIYRNGVKIADTESLTFCDETAPIGDATYQVSVYGDFGETALSSAVTVSVSSVRELNVPKVRYNHSTHCLILPEASDITIYSTGGAVVLHRTSGVGELSVADLPSGMYLARIVTATGSEVIRFIK